jgi:shikimate dehydrogenase
MEAARVTRDALPDFIRGVRALGVRGLAITMPHKASVIELLDEIDPQASRIGAVNTVTQNNGRLTGHNTDWIGIVKPLERLTSLKDKRVAVLGAGGAAAAAVFGCLEGGARVTVFNRTKQNADILAERLGCQSAELLDATSITDCDIIINTTSVGMGEGGIEQSPLEAAILRPNHIVFETIYAPYTTKLLEYASAVGATIIRGLDMFLEQGAAQFELHTGSTPPKSQMEQILLSSRT